MSTEQRARVASRLRLRVLALSPAAPYPSSNLVGDETRHELLQERSFETMASLFCMVLRHLISTLDMGFAE